MDRQRTRPRGMRLIAACLALASAVLAAPNLSVNVNTKDGSLQILLDSEVWFQTAATMMRSNGRTYTSGGGGLQLSGSRAYAGTDGFGSYAATELSWTAADGSNTPFVTTVREYGSFAVFQQAWPKGAVGTSTGNRDGVVSSFPTIGTNSLSSGVRRGYLAISGDMDGSDPHFGNWTETTGKLPDGISGTGPVIVFTEDLSQSVVWSPASHFFAASHSITPGAGPAGAASVQMGAFGNASLIPVGYSMEFICAASPQGGVNAAMQNWGRIMRQRWNKGTEREDDFSLRTLQYSTDNGAVYYYNPEAGKDYQDTMFDVKQYMEKMNIPVRNMLLDSWWYFKGPDGGVTEWLPMPSIFPGGMDTVYNFTQWPIVGHNRYWSYQTVYATQNGGDFDFLIEGVKGVPLEQEFWDFLLITSRQWGLVVYEQDWLDTTTDTVPSMTSNVTLGEMWLRQMATAAQNLGLKIQYCMSHVRHILQSLQFPAVTQARASGDYHSNLTDQWMIGVSSMLADAVGIAPSKDNAWSVAVQPANNYNDGRTEPDSRLQFAVLSLSRGPVALSDGVGYSDPSVIMTTCTGDGTLMRPDRPATLLDSVVLTRALSLSQPDGEVWSTTSTIAGRVNAHLLAAQVTGMMPITLGQLGLTAAQASSFIVSSNNDSTPLVTLTANGSIPVQACGKSDFQLFHVAPVQGQSGWALLGEVDKNVPTSSDRFVDLVDTPSGLTAWARGHSGESVAVAFARPGDRTPTIVTCTVGPSAAFTVSVPSMACADA